jgi:hypothetical protein
MKPEKRRKRLSMILVFFLMAAYFNVLPFHARTALAAGNTYYVDSSRADDSGDGLTPSTAWKSLSKVNSTTFQPGDHVLFKAGGIWNGQLWPKGSGSAGNPIVIDMYGTGNKPVFNGGGNDYLQTLANTTTTYNSGTVFLKNQEYWEINNLEVTNDDNFATEFNDSTFQRAGIFVIVDTNLGDQVYNHIYIRNCYVHDVDGSNNPTIKDNGGIIARLMGDNHSVARFNDMRIENNVISKVDRSGIRAGNSNLDPRTSGNWVTGLYIGGNTLSDIGGDGIVIVDTDNGLVEHNVVTSFGKRVTSAIAGIWQIRTKNTVIQYNEVYGGPASNQDGCAYDFDLWLQDAKIQYNYSHDNPMGHMLMMGGNKNDVMRYNISQNDGYLFRHFAANESTPAYIYNNVYYYDGSKAKINGDSATKSGYNYINNIFYNTSTTSQTVWGTGWANFDHNLFFEASGVHPAGEPVDANKLTVDPQFVNRGGAGIGWNTAAAYQLRTGSPAIGAGAIVSNNGGKDYFGNSVSSSTAPNIGAYNGNGVNVNPTNVFEPIDDSAVRDGGSANVNQSGATSTLLDVKSDAAGYRREVYLKFDFNDFIGNVGNAKVVLTPTVVSATVNHNIYLVSDSSWTETGITWNNKPASSTLIATVTPSLNVPIVLDVSQLIKDALTTGKKLSLRIVCTTAPGSDKFVSYASGENANVAIRPKLMISSQFGSGDDATVRDGSYADSNQSGMTSTQLDVKSDGTGYNREAFLKFDFATYTSTVSNAKIILNPTVGAATPNRVEWVPNNTWTENAITWNNKPASSTVLGNYTVSQGTPIVIDVTSQVQAALSGDKKVSIRIYSTATPAQGLYVSYVSAEHIDASLQPKLVITP